MWVPHSDRTEPLVINAGSESNVLLLHKKETCRGSGHGLTNEPLPERLCHVLLHRLGFGFRQRINM